MGHRAAAFEQEQYATILENALEWTLGVVADTACTENGVSETTSN
jgi:type 1 glutamine amidotransferase